MVLPLIAAAVGIVSAGVGIASGIQGLSQAAADKKTINTRNEAVRIANKEVSEINKDIRAATKGITEAFAKGTQKQNRIIDETNTEIRDLNAQAVRAIEGANQEIQTINALNVAKSFNEREQEQIRVAREIRQATRERMLRESQLRASAAVAGAEGSGLEGGSSSLSSQTGEVIGNATRVSAITENTFEIDLAAALAQGRALGLQNQAELSQIAAVQAQREGEANLRIAQNKQNLAVTRKQNEISLLQNRADRIRENAQAAPGATIKQTKKQERNDLRSKWKNNNISNDAIKRRLERRGLTGPQINKKPPKKVTSKTTNALAESRGI